MFILGSCSLVTCHSYGTFDWVKVILFPLFQVHFHINELKYIFLIFTYYLGLGWI